MNDRDVVDSFVTYLENHGYPGLRVDRRPDNENRDSLDIDAIAGAFAVEHTSIDALPNQRRNSHWLEQVTGGLRQEILSTLSFRVIVILGYGAISRGQDWTAIRQALKNWFIKEVPLLTDGRHVIENIPGVPFRLQLIKASDRRPGVFFRVESDDSTLAGRIRELFDRKAKKLAKYHGGKTTVLLVESADIALMDEWTLLDAIRQAYSGGPPHTVDEIWYADTSIPGQIDFKDLTSALMQEDD